MAVVKDVIKVDGMSCAACSARIEKALKKDQGVLESYANFTNNTVSGKWESIGVGRFDHATGDVGKLVAAGGGKSIVWQPRHDWPGQKVAGGNVKCEVKAWPTNAPPPF